MKICSKCKLKLPLDQFYRMTRSKDGRHVWCKVCDNSYKREWRDKNREHVNRIGKAQQYNWYHNNLERARETARKWQRENKDRVYQIKKRFAENNPEKLKEYQDRWNKANPEKVKMRADRRRAKKKDAFVENVSSLVVLELDDGICGICGKDVDPTNFHIDHVIPLARGGEHSYNNSQVAHPKCNQMKWSHEEFKGNG